MVLTKAAVLKHDFPVHGRMQAFWDRCSVLGHDVRNVHQDFGLEGEESMLGMTAESSCEQKNVIDWAEVKWGLTYRRAQPREDGPLKNHAFRPSESFFE